MTKQSQSNSTAPIDFIKLLLANLQINKYTDPFHMYLIVPMGLLGSLFNLVSSVIFCQKSFHTLPLFKYLRVYTLASLIVSFGLIFIFYLAPYTFPQILWDILPEYMPAKYYLHLWHLFSFSLKILWTFS